MKTEWDYSALAESYVKRPEYAPDALEKIITTAGLSQESRICDVGAGVAHLTIPLAKLGCHIDAVEPNDAMRTLGIERTKQYPAVSWYEGTGEETGRPYGVYDFVSFGSSFNACKREKALQETYNLLKPGKYFVCLWNHRDLEDPIQKEIESIIKKSVSSYGYGTRREDQSEVINKSGLFGPITYIEGKIFWKEKIQDVIEAWGSHATLQRQSGDSFTTILKNISDYLLSLNQESITIPYTTRAWMAARLEK